MFIAEKYGSLTSLMKDRRHLGRKEASFFIFAYYYRRLLFVAMIFIFYEYSVVQINMVLLLNLSFLGLQITLRPYNSGRE